MPDNKEAIVHFRVTKQKKNSFYQKYGDKERSKILRWLLDSVLSNRIAIPKEVIQTDN